MGARAGLTLVEVSVSVVIVVALVLASAATFGENIQAVDQAARTSDAALFLETTMQNVAAVDHADLLALDGNQLFDGETLARSNFTIDLEVTTVAVGLLQVTASLRDLRRGTELTRASVLRAAR